MSHTIQFRIFLGSVGTEYRDEFLDELPNARCRVRKVKTTLGM